MKYLRYLEKIIEKILTKYFPYNLLIVIGFTLFPFDFDFRGNFSLQTVLNSFYHSSNFFDAVFNVLLFVYFGYRLTDLIQKYPIKPIIVLFSVFCLSFVLSCSIEILQVFLPSRSPTLVDIITNSIGGCIGLTIFYSWKKKFTKYAISKFIAFINYFSIKILLIGIIVYAALILMFLGSLRQVTSLNNWDAYFPLILGNERTGDRPWHGYISSFYMTDRILSEQEIVDILDTDNYPTNISKDWPIAYKYTGRNNFNKQETMPEISWQGKSPDIENKLRNYLGPNTWLQTSEPPTYITNRIRETSKFSLNITFATANSSQTGPARIISFSNSPNDRNFTLAQQGVDLVIRLRTPVTGRNGSNPEIIIKNILSDLDNHHLVLSYSGKILKVYLDKIQNLYTFDLFPEVALFRLINRPNSPLSKTSMKSYKILYYVLVFLPFSFFLGLVDAVTLKKSNVFIFSMYSGILLPIIFMEIILAEGNMNNMNFDNVILGSVILFSMSIFFKGKFVYCVNSGENIF